MNHLDTCFSCLPMKATRKPLIFGALFSLLSMSCHADVIGFSIGASYWAPEFSGDFDSVGQSSIDLSSDLGLDDSSLSSLVLSLEHPIPLLPNIKYQNNDLADTGSNVLTSSVVFEGETYSVSDRLDSTFDLSHEDFILYYELLDNWVNLDVGVDVKRFDGEVALVGNANTTTSRIEIDETLALLYLSARFDLPLSGFYIGADFSGVSIDDSSVQDTTLKLGYLSDYGLGVEGGLRNFLLELDDSNGLNSDIEYDGAYAYMFFRF